MSNLPALKQFGNSPAIKEKLEKLTSNSEAFISTVVSLCNDDYKLAACDPKTVWVAAMKSATLNLSVDKTLGYAYIIPYKTTAQFQLGYKGLIQLAIRSGKYKSINTTPVYQDEIEGFNPLSQEFTFKEGFNPKADRFTGGEAIGYYASFELITGFKTSVFMSREQVIEHAKQYSQAYSYDLKSGKKNSPWSTNFDAMAMKTPLKQLLSKFGLLSTSMETAIASDTAEEKQPIEKTEYEVVEELVPVVEVEEKGKTTKKTTKKTTDGIPVDNFEQSNAAPY